MYLNLLDDIIIIKVAVLQMMIHSLRTGNDNNSNDYKIDM